MFLINMVYGLRATFHSDDCHTPVTVTIHLQTVINYLFLL